MIFGAAGSRRRPRLRRAQRVLGPDHPDILTTRYNLTYRVIALDIASVVVSKQSGFFTVFTVAAMLTLGEEKVIADGVRDVTPKVSAILEAAAVRKRKFERLTADLQKALEHFRAVAGKRLGSVRRPRFWHPKK